MKLEFPDKEGDIGIEAYERLLDDVAIACEFVNNKEFDEAEEIISDMTSFRILVNAYLHLYYQHRGLTGAVKH